MKTNYKHTELTEKIIGSAYNVYNTLGWGFLESVYQNAMAIELEKTGLKFETEKQINVCYENRVIGDFIADIVVENKVIVELKAVRELSPAHETQLVNYLKATGIEVGLLINSGEKIQIMRKAFDASRKPNQRKSAKSASKKISTLR